MKSHLIILGISVLALILLPIGIFYVKFRYHFISDNPTNWGVFGDFIGGTVGTITGIVSLIILSWLTYAVAKNSSKDAFKHQVILKRMDVYLTFANHLYEFNLLSRRLDVTTRYTESFLKFSDNVVPQQYADLNLRNLNSLTSLHELSQHIFNFNLLYGHLFDYDFSSKEFESLLQSAKELKNYAIELEKAIFTGEIAISDIKVPGRFIEDCTNFANALRREMPINK